MAIWRQSGLVWTGAIAAAGLALLTQILLARNLGDEAFGSLSNAYAIAVLVATFAFQGLGEIALRNLAAFDVGRCVAAAGSLLLVGLIAGTLWTSWTGEAGSSPGLLIAFIPFILVQGGLTAGMISFQLDRRNVGIAAWPAGFQLARLVVVGLVILAGASVIFVPIGWFAALTPLAWIGIRRLRAAKARTGRVAATSTTGLLRAALPFSATRLLEFAEIQLPVVLAMPMLGAAETGRIAACLAIVQGLLLLPISIFQRLLRAGFHDWARDDPARLRRTGLLGVVAMAGAGAGLGLAIRPFASTILGSVFGDHFAAGDGFLGAMMWLLPIWFASIAINATLVSPRLADLRFGCQVVGVAILAGGTWFGGSWFGGSGTDGIVTGMFASQTFLLGSGIMLATIRRSSATRD
ncbi:MAG: hypothetical protein CMJ52_10545 [Planctomycetaceae bacterium]|nr:hypothetical protein [Planctomycetaceae bacterium]